MRTPRLVAPLVLGAVVLAGCTSFTEGAAGGSTSSSADPTTGTGSTTPSASGADLSVGDTEDLSVSASAVTGARVVTGSGATGGAAVLLTGPTSTVVTVDGSATDPSDVDDVAATDVVLVDGDPVVVGLAADPVSGDPVVALARPGAAPVELDPQRSARRGAPVLAAAGDGVVHLLVEDADALVTRVLTVDPSTGRVRGDVVLDLGGDATSIDLVGLAATSGGGLVAGLDVRSGDGTSAGRLVSLADGRQQGGAQQLDAPLLALTSDGAPITESSLGDDAADSRVSGAASTGGTTVVGLRDQDSPTVLVIGTDGDPATLALCDGEGDALALARSGAGDVLVAGTCDGDARLWTLG